MVRYTSKIPKVIAGMEGKASAVVTKVVFDVEASAKGKAPVDTGNLRNSIGGKMTGPLSGEVNASADYATYVELGTHNAAAQPFMTPAAEEHRALFAAAMGQIVR